MELFEVRIWDPGQNKESIIQTTIENMIKHPDGLNILDVGIYLLNDYRAKEGLKPIDPAMYVGSIQDLRKTGRL